MADDKTDVPAFKDGGDAEKPKEEGDPKNKGGEGGQEGDDHEPPVRRSAASFIIARKEKKIQKMKDAAKDKDDGEDEDGMAPEDKDFVNKQVKEATAPILDHVRGQSDEAELKEVLAAHPDAKKLEKGIRKYMGHPAYAGVSVEMIYYGLAGRLGFIGKDGARSKADAEAAEAAMGGSGRRPSDTKLPDFGKMSNEEFQKWDKEHNR